MYSAKHVVISWTLSLCHEGVRLSARVFISASLTSPQIISMITRVGFHISHIPWHGVIAVFAYCCVCVFCVILSYLSSFLVSWWAFKLCLWSSLLARSRAQRIVGLMGLKHDVAFTELQFYLEHLLVHFTAIFQILFTQYYDINTTASLLIILSLLINQR